MTSSDRSSRPWPWRWLPLRSRERRLPGVLPAAEFEAAFAAERARLERQDGCMVLVLVHLDRPGRAPLLALAELLTERARGSDAVGPLGGRGLAVLLPGTRLEGARAFLRDVAPGLGAAGLHVDCELVLVGEPDSREATLAPEEGAEHPLGSVESPAELSLEPRAGDGDLFPDEDSEAGEGEEPYGKRLPGRRSRIV